MDTVRIGLIGYGRFGRCHAEAITRSEHAELAGIAVRTEATCLQACSECGVPATTDYRELLARPDVDAVDIVVPPDLHAPMAVAALRAGKHVLLEKPMALAARQCDRIQAEASSRGLTLCVNFELRASPLWSRVKSDVDRGAIGRPLFGSYDLRRFPFREGAESWRYTRERVGSWVHEEPVHYVDLAAWLFEGLGAPSAISADLVGRAGAPVELSENMAFVLRWPDRRFFQVTQTNSFFGYCQQVRVAGEEAAILAVWEGATEGDEEARHDYFIVRGSARERIPIEAASTESLDMQHNIERFCLRARGAPADIADGADGRRAVAMVEAALRSARSGRPVRLL